MRLTIHLKYIKDKMQIPSEDFLHFIWKTKSFDLNSLKTTIGEEIQILDFGIHNHDAGPDFSLSKITIDNQLWVGNIEIHVNASDWKRHKHDENSAYDSVILHVVHLEDKEIYNSKGHKIPTLELKGRISKNMLKTYASLVNMDNENWIPCQNMLYKVSDLRKSIFQEKLLIERLQEKTHSAELMFEEEKGDWYMVFVRILLQAFGTKVNKVGFTMLGERLNKRLILECINEPTSLEALLFGLAGFLNDPDDSYTHKLHEIFEFLKLKHSLQKMEPETWKFSRMRPQNFPTIRIAQFSSTLIKNKDILNELLDLNTVAKYADLFSCQVSQYWETHYTFGVVSEKSRKGIGKSMQDIICINSFAPFLFLYGIKHDDQSYKDAAVNLLSNLKAEKNNITRKWEALGMQNASAKDSQSLIHLKNKYCSKLKCLSCDIGYVILKSE